MATQIFTPMTFTEISPARDLKEVWRNFDPTFVVDPASAQYIPRTDPKLDLLSFTLKASDAPVHAFLCGHRGSGKTTELNRLCIDPEITDKFLPVYLTAREFGGEGVHLTHDAVLVEIGRKLVESKAVDESYGEELDRWGRQIVKTFLKDEAALAEAGAKGSAWFAFFKAQLATRSEWKYEQKQILAPKVQDLVDLLNRMAQNLKNKARKSLLVIVDDLEKGESDAHKAMHGRLFTEHYDTLVQPYFSIVYTLPIYFRSMVGSRIPNDELYAFSAIRLYDRRHAPDFRPPLDKQGAGYTLMKRFIEKRIEQPGSVFAESTVLDELLRIGGGLFRETARAIREAAYFAIRRGSERIDEQDTRHVFDRVKKEYQPMVRGDAVQILREVAKTGRWVEGVEPFLQSRAVVEYENGDLWLDLRYVLKSYVQRIAEEEGGSA